ncbi:MAG: aldo/keto reductase, partial [Melioribacteraceae bacterium]
LKRLETDYIDLYQIHWPDPNVPIEESWNTMADLRKEGKVRYIGVSNFDVPLLERCMKIARVQSLQPPFSLLKRDYEESVLPYCLQNEIGVVAYSPMQAGLLTGKFDLKKVAQDDWRRDSSFCREPYLSKAMEFVEMLRPIAESSGKTVGQLAVAWVLQNPSMTAAIVGARTEKQVEENAAADGYKLSKEEIEKIGNILIEAGL